MGAWDNAPEAEGSGVNFVTLKDGDKFVGRVESVELVTIPKGTLPQQPQDLTDVPQVIYTGVDGQTYQMTYTTAVMKNAILRLRPEIGTWVFHHRIGKAPGKSYVNAVVRAALPHEYEVSRTAQPVPANDSYTVSSAPEAKSFDAEPAASAGPVGDDAPPF
jgi:hypothetical protein